MAGCILDPMRRVKAVGIPFIHVDGNVGRWRSNLASQAKVDIRPSTGPPIESLGTVEIRDQLRTDY